MTLLGGSMERVGATESAGWRGRNTKNYFLEEMGKEWCHTQLKYCSKMLLKFNLSFVLHQNKLPHVNSVT